MKKRCVDALICKQRLSVAVAGIIGDREMGGAYRLGAGSSALLISGSVVIPAASAMGSIECVFVLSLVTCVVVFKKWNTFRGTYHDTLNVMSMK